MCKWGLVDLKRLHDDVAYWEQHADPKQADYDTRDIEAVIGSQPIVDAIPVEWLKEWFKKHERTIIWWDCIHVVIDRILEDWENKNESK